ncbi:hypothetical protein BaRGS_00030327 [Batillaria attramentaria]|uniref:c-SKI SMAD4-binding domain-containing protein n=1 Tax=Batillaria attramentaria TaxID=370345 RepID=A0ABD0JTQ0_9CAEN
MDGRGQSSPLDASAHHQQRGEDQQHAPHIPTPGPVSPNSSEGWKKTPAPPTPTPSAPPQARQNHVSTVMLSGEAIVSLSIDGKERLCLAQISNTLLKDYSYNEIHNRRVALGITCVQCTPVQLEILRRAGAMPVSSRRCGMITKREAERLVKSFLEDAEPPKLPEDFAFQVYHECGWGCHGYFEPARYNSSRAKCIKCGFCSVYFSPNKFIFHFHRTSETKYHHPDAANFNSWRRHLKLVGGGTDEEMHVWEDVKAMFNGGTRKRVFSSVPRTSTSGPKPDIRTVTDTARKSSKVGSGGSDLQVTPKHPFPTHFSPYSWYGAGTKPSYPFVSVNTSQSLCFGFPPPQGVAKDNVTPDNPMLKGGMGPLPAPWLGRTALPFSNLDAFWDKAFGLPRPLGGGFRGGGGAIYPPPACNSGSSDRFSAFRPVGRNAHVQGDNSGAPAVSDDTAGLPGDVDETEEIDQDVREDADDSQDGGVVITKELVDDDCHTSETDEPVEKRPRLDSDNQAGEDDEVEEGEHEDGENKVQQEHDGTHDGCEGQDPERFEENRDNPRQEERGVTGADDSGLSEELCQSLKRELCNRKKREKEVNMLRETFQEEVTREKAFRDQMARQLEVLRETLTNELEQERKVRFSLQQKLKEAHDALHSFSCSMLTAARDGCGYKDTVLPR